MLDTSLKDILYTLYKKKIMIIIFTIVGALAGMLYVTFLVTPMYRADTSLLLVKKDLESNNSITQTDMTLNQQLVSTYSEIIKSRAVVGEVIENMQLSTTEQALTANIAVVPKNKTELLQITVQNKEPQMAADIANNLSETFLKKVKQIYKMENVSIIDKAQVPLKPFNIDIVKTSILTAGLGFVLGAALVLIKLFTDLTIKNENDIEKSTGLNVIAVIPENKE